MCLTFCSQDSVLPSIFLHLSPQYMIHNLLDVSADHRWVMHSPGLGRRVLRTLYSTDPSENQALKQAQR